MTECYIKMRLERSNFTKTFKRKRGKYRCDETGDNSQS